MKITLQMMVGQLRAFRLEAHFPDSIANKGNMTTSKVNSCFDLAEEQIKEARELIGSMPIGHAPVVTHNFHVKKKGNQIGEGK